MKAGRLVIALILTALPALGRAGETASKDPNRVPAILGHDPTSFATDRLETDGAGALKVLNVAGGSMTANQGTSGVDTDPWNMMIRNASGTEVGLAASPFSVSIFDAASNLLGVTANPLVVDLGVNNDVTVTSGSITVDNGAGASAVNIQDGGNSITVDGTMGLTGDSSDLDSGAGTDDHETFAIGLPGAGGHVVGGTSTDPLRTDPTGTTTQPVSDAGGSLTVDVGTALPAGTNAIGKLAANSGVDIGDVTINNTTLGVAGPAADGAAVSGNPVRIAGKDGSGNTQDILTDTSGNMQIGVATALPAGSNNIGDVDLASAIPAGTNNIGDVDLASSIPAGTNNIGDVDIASALPAGTNNIGDVDIVSSVLPTGASTSANQTTANTSLSDIELNTDTGTAIDHLAVTVGTTATQILASSATRRTVTIINAFTDLLAVGNSDVTLNSVAATDGFVLAASGAANDGTGGALTLTTTSAVFGIGASASSKVIIVTESD